MKLVLLTFMSALILGTTSVHAGEALQRDLNLCFFGAAKIAEYSSFGNTSMRTDWETFRNEVDSLVINCKKVGSRRAEARTVADVIFASQLSSCEKTRHHMNELKLDSDASERAYTLCQFNAVVGYGWNFVIPNYGRTVED